MRLGRYRTRHPYPPPLRIEREARGEECLPYRKGNRKMSKKNECCLPRIEIDNEKENGDVDAYIIYKHIDAEAAWSLGTENMAAIFDLAKGLSMCVFKKVVVTKLERVMP